LSGGAGQIVWTVERRRWRWRFEPACAAASGSCGSAVTSTTALAGAHRGCAARASRRSSAASCRRLRRPSGRCSQRQDRDVGRSANRAADRLL